MSAAFERSLVRSKCRFKTLGIASQHAPHLAKAKTELAQCRYLGDAGHLIGTICSPAGRRTSWCDQAALFVEPQSLDGNTQPRGGLGSTQELRGGAHESPRHWLTAILIAAAPRGGSSTYSPTPAISPVIKL